MRSSIDLKVRGEGIRSAAITDFNNYDVSGGSSVSPLPRLLVVFLRKKKKHSACVPSPLSRGALMAVQMFTPVSTKYLRVEGEGWSFSIA